MDDSVQLILRKVIAVGTAVMMVVTLAAIAVVKFRSAFPPRKSGRST